MNNNWRGAYRKNSYKIDKAGPTLIGIVPDFLLAIEASIYLSDCSGE